MPWPGWRRTRQPGRRSCAPRPSPSRGRRRPGSRRKPSGRWRRRAGPGGAPSTPRRRSSSRVRCPRLARKRGCRIRQAPAACASLPRFTWTRPQAAHRTSPLGRPLRLRRAEELPGPRLGPAARQGFSRPCRGLPCARRRCRPCRKCLRCRPTTALRWLRCTRRRSLPRRWFNLPSHSGCRSLRSRARSTWRSPTCCVGTAHASRQSQRAH